MTYTDASARASTLPQATTHVVHEGGDIVIRVRVVPPAAPVVEDAPRDELPPILSYAQAAQVLDISRRKLSTIVASGELPVLDYVRPYKFLRDDVLDYARKHRVTLADSAASDA